MLFYIRDLKQVFLVKFAIDEVLNDIGDMHLGISALSG